MGIFRQSMKNKKALWITLICLDVAVTVFLFVISIIMIVRSMTMNQAEILNATGFIGYLQNHTTVYLVGFVLPLFLLLAANIAGLVIYVRRQTKAEAKSEPVSVNDLSEEQKAALREELLNDLKGDKKDE